MNVFALQLHCSVFEDTHHVAANKNILSTFNGHAESLPPATWGSRAWRGSEEDLLTIILSPSFPDDARGIIRRNVIDRCDTCLLKGHDMLYQFSSLVRVL